MALAESNVDPQMLQGSFKSNRPLPSTAQADMMEIPPPQSCSVKGRLEVAAEGVESRRGGHLDGRRKTLPINAALTRQCLIKIALCLPLSLADRLAPASPLPP